MSVLPDFSDAGNSIGRRVPEKSNFSQTCSLLSRYLKRNASFGDLNLGIASNSEIQGNNSEMFRQTRNLLPNMEISVSDPCQELNSIDLFPQQAGFTHHKAVSLKASSTDFRHVVEPETAQMTIFYGGQVLVLDKIAAERAKEVMLLARKSEQKKSVVRFVPPVATNLISACVNNSTQDGGPKLPPRPHVSGLPIARKASLHRFLEKRKDRLNAKSPYQLNNSVSSAAHTNPADSSKKAWLGLSSESSPGSLELQL